MARRVLQGANRVTVLTDVVFGDHTELDKYFQIIYSPDSTMADWKRMIRDKTVVIKCPIVALFVGNAQLPFPDDVSPSAQMKKLLLCLWETYEDKVKKVVVFTGLPRPDKETELETQIKLMNGGFYKSVREIKRFYPVARNTGVMPIHRLFLERYEYFDFTKGRTVYMVRIVKPVSRYYTPGTRKLNPVGLYHLRSHVLQELGLASNISSWEGMPTRMEPLEIQEDKRRAWLKTQNYEQEQLAMEEEVQGDTDVEDEAQITVVPDSQSERSSDLDSSSAGGVPIFCQGRRVLCKSDVK